MANAIAAIRTRVFTTHALSQKGPGASPLLVGWMRQRTADDAATGIRSLVARLNSVQHVAPTGLAVDMQP
eukprot:2077181-Alexandrium_andersonii.AAC.1